MEITEGVNNGQIPTEDEAWKMYNFINDWKNGTFGIQDLDTVLFGYYEQYKSN